MYKNPNPPTPRKETVRGFVVPEQWDDQYRVTRVIIACNGERDIRVENFEKFPMLLTFSQTEASITGIIRNDHGVESILVEQLSPVVASHTE